MELKQLRDRIDEIDAQILKLLNERAMTAKTIGITKKEKNIDILNRTREKQVLDNLVVKNNGPLSDKAILNIFTVIIQICREIQF